MLSSSEPINEFLLEIRFSPNPKILDYRGTWAETASKHMELSEWQIQENRFDTHDKENTRRFFVSYKNTGALIRNITTKNYFSDQANKFLRFLFEQKSFGNELYVERFGVRAKFATPFEGSYQELIERYTSRFVTVNTTALDLMNAKLLDINVPIDFSTSLGNINTNSGPMPKSQIKSFLGFAKELPEVSLYFDLDYWVKPKETLSDREILNKSKLFSSELWELNAKITSWILS